MKILNSPAISSFGGLNFVIKEVIDLKINNLFNSSLPTLPSQSRYNWFDIIMSYWSVFFCGGDCAEDLTVNLRPTFRNHPTINLPSPDRVLERIKSLSTPSVFFKTPRGKTIHQFSINKNLNQINLKLLKKLTLLNARNNTLDYDNTLIFTNKSDAANTYKRQHGYCPGVGIIGSNVVYVENRNGNSNPEVHQKETLQRMFDVLEDNHIHIGTFRADGASYTLDTITEIVKHVDKFYVRAGLYDTIAELLPKIKEWKEVNIDGRIAYRSSIMFTPFEKTAKRTNRTSLSEKYRLVITKELRDDGQINMFTGETYNYRTILTNDHKMTDDEVVFFYNQRGTIEREFDILKNDFGWNRIPFSKLEYNTVFLIITSMCRNLYDYIIKRFSKTYKYLQPFFRIKKFIFRFICIPAKWIWSGRERKLRIYGQVAFKT
ncbi:MAG: IS1380 family transposase [Bacteroidales bacterium]|nr:IS1380 family transposase [Bacteroidales bacterium]